MGAASRGRARCATVAALPEFSVMAVGLIAVRPHRTAGAGFSINAAVNPVVIVSGYLAALVVLIVFGIWGFRLASRDIGNDGRNRGPEGPESEPPTPTEGREADLADSAPDRQEKVPAGVR
ncbi:MAG TPA: hypothetical protein VMA73_32435 [Streptosporangiaceae bacterium]|nr:hypothetical protein [Streptosporangiaceae bacterium]